MTPLLVALGAALGGALRHLVATILDDRRWPHGTLLVNVAGSGLLGLATALALQGLAWAFVATGLCGALTTLSTFAVQTIEQPRATAMAYVAATVVGSVGLCALGWWVGSGIG